MREDFARAFDDFTDPDNHGLIQRQMKFLSHDEKYYVSEKSHSSSDTDNDEKNYQKKDLAKNKDLRILKTLTKEKAIKGQVQLDIDRIRLMNKPVKINDDDEDMQLQ